MERKTCIATILLLIIMSFTIQANFNRQKDIYDAFVKGDMNKWMSIIIEMEKTPGIRTKEQKLELTEYYYGLAAYQISKKNYKSAKITINKAELLLDLLLKSDPKNATILAYKGSFTAYKISLDKIKVVVLGKESLKYLDEAYKYDPNNIQALTDKGHALFNAPKLFGGDKNEAIRFFLKSIALIEKNNMTNQNWIYLNNIVQAAKAYTETGQREKARQLYLKVLQKEPNFGWVKNELYPELIKTMAN